MAIIPDNAGSGDVTTEQNLLQGADSCAAVYVKCLASSAANLELNVPKLHNDAWLLLEPGDAFIARFSTARLDVANVKAQGVGTATISWGISALL